jgi:hypothetical protein
VQPCDDEDEQFSTKFYKQWSTSGMKSTGENRQLGEKPVPVPLCPPQISHGLEVGSNPGLRGERPATNRLSHGTADTVLHCEDVAILEHWTSTVCVIFLP